MRACVHVVLHRGISRRVRSLVQWAGQVVAGGMPACLLLMVGHHDFCPSLASREKHVSSS